MLEGINSRLANTKECFNDLEDMLLKIKQPTEIQRKSIT